MAQSLGCFRHHFAIARRRISCVVQMRVIRASFMNKTDVTATERAILWNFEGKRVFQVSTNQGERTSATLFFAWREIIISLGC